VCIFYRVEDICLTPTEAICHSIRNAAAANAGEKCNSRLWLNMLEKLIPQPGFLTVCRLRLDLVYIPLRSSPRFQTLLRKHK